jgi:predicted TIM-barrel fold metal-dependent hydrolase
MDRFGIRKAIVLPPPQIDAHLLYDFSELAQALRPYAHRFAFLGGGGSLNAMLHRYADPAKVGDVVRRAFAAAAEKMIDAGAVGFGEMAALHISAARGHPYEFVPADHPLLRELADVAASRDVPIELHMDAVVAEMPTPERFREVDNPPRLPATLEALDRLLSHNPKAKIIWAHGGSDPLGGMTPAAIGRLMATHPNLFVSLRVVGWQAPVHNKVLAAGAIEPAWRDLLMRHPDRFMIGTDSFFAGANLTGGGPGLTFAQRNVPKLKAMIHFLSLLPSQVARKVARDNAERVYKFSLP